MTKNGAVPEIAGQSSNLRLWSAGSTREPLSTVSALPTSSPPLRPPPLQIATRTNRVTLSRTGLVEHLDKVNEMHARCSPASLYARYRGVRRALAKRDWEHLCDPANGTTMITVPLDDPYRIIAVTHLMRTTTPHVRELGILVEDSWQGQGLGTALARCMVDFARTQLLDCQAIRAMTSRDNQRSMSILRWLGAQFKGASGSTIDALIRVEN
ncbi:GNAT family N-acetyltransferase [Streptomyces sp. HC44]|uniref:GNAT family N-acetyltransferase n=1 Tax=Streptomyces scabichelini TaxID=2711217 RepID=A0A6G4VGX1_9ACTN|nr:GNAT family protein [Streptomyces scabichelini]NGO13398.1 GNAT family N-acetyltransferase [Streptomyces scabichelini]